MIKGGALGKGKLLAAGFGMLVSGLVSVNAAVAQLSCSKWNTYAFFKAATAADVARCLEGGANINARDQYGSTSLHFAAARSDSPDVVQALLKAGAYINARDDRGTTPLHHAAVSSSSPYIVQALLDAGANPKAKDIYGYTMGNYIDQNDTLKGTYVYWLLKQ